MNRSLALFCFAVFLVPMAAKNLAAKNKDTKNSGVIQSESLDQYLQRMQQSALIARPPSTGSLWIDSGRLADLGADYKARHVGDLITITVVQNITATNAGSVSSTRNLSASSGISALPAQLKTANVASLFSPTSAYSLAGKGSSSDNLQLDHQPGGPSGGGAAERGAGD